MIYSQDGTPLFRAIEESKHHPWCNWYFKDRKGCKMCQGLYYQFPVDDDGNISITDHFPNVQILTR